MITTGKDAQLAQVSADLYHRAFNVMGGSNALDEFNSLTPAESYGVEYWPSNCTNSRCVRPTANWRDASPLLRARHRGIGRSAAYRLAQEGAHVVIADLNLEGAQTVAEDISKRFGLKRGLAVQCNEQYIYYVHIARLQRIAHECTNARMHECGRRQQCAPSPSVLGLRRSCSSRLSCLFCIPAFLHSCIWHLWIP